MDNVGRLQAFFCTLESELIPFRDVSAERLRLRCKKRARIPGQGLEDKAFSKFIWCNDYVAAFERLQYNPDKAVIAEAREFILRAFWRYTSSLDEDAIQETIIIDELFNRWRFGPGSSNGVKGTHTADKISQSMTCTSSALPFVVKLRSTNVYLSAFDMARGYFGVTEVKGSKLSTVPKNEDTVRTIAIEPSGNMAFQLALGSYMEGVLRAIGIDIREQQPKNKAAALRGSIDGSLATIDLSSASDLISIKLVRDLLPGDVYSLIDLFRSKVCTIPGKGDVVLNMVSTMGNGFTFPLMTLIITSLIYGYRRVHGLTKANYIDFESTCVFGDDIIVPNDEFGLCVETLESVGFIVNKDKSYSAGPFRESCGGDYYSGRDITPFYVKSLSCDPEVYVAINQLLEWCGRNNILLHQSLKHLISFLDGPLYLVPEWLGDTAGLRTSAVNRRFKYLRLKQKRKRLRDEHFLLPLAAGGYLTSGSGGAFYSPRLYKNEYCVARGRLPRGYLNGVCPLERAHTVSTFIEAYSFLYVKGWGDSHRRPPD